MPKVISITLTGLFVIDNGDGTFSQVQYVPGDTVVSMKAKYATADHVNHSTISQFLGYSW